MSGSSPPSSSNSSRLVVPSSSVPRSNGTPFTPTFSSSSPSPIVSESVEIMRQGRTFTQYYRAGDSYLKRDIFLWYDENDGKLGTFWYDDDDDDDDDGDGRVGSVTRTKSMDRCLPLRHIRHIYLGKQTPELRSVSSEIPSNRCFSLLLAPQQDSSTSSTGLHLCCDSSSLRTCFLNGIKEVCSRKICTIVNTNMNGNGTHTTTSSTTSSDKSTSPSVQAMETGNTFTCLFPSSPETPDIPVKKHVLVWYDARRSKLGSLLMSENHMKEGVESGVDLDRISDVYLGKQSSLLKSGLVSDVSNSLCFSIIAKEKQMHLIAASEAIRNTWLDGIKHVYRTSGKRINSIKTIASSVTPISAANDASFSSGIEGQENVVPTQTTTAISILEEGRVFTLYTGVPPVALEVFVWVDKSKGKLGTIFYGAPSLGFIAAPERCVDIHQIRNVDLGKKALELQGATASSSRCFSVLTKDHSLHLVADSADSRSAWLDAVKNTFLSADGKTVPSGLVSSTPLSQPFPATIAASSSFSSSSSAVADVAVSPSGSQVLKQGGVFVRVQKLSSSSSTCDNVIRQQVFVFYDENDNRLGTLYWCDADMASARPKIVEHSIPLNLLSDVYVGQKAPEFHSLSAEEASSSRAFSLITRERSIHLIAPSNQVRVTWLKAMKDIFASASRRVDDSKSKKKSTHNTTINTTTSCSHCSIS